MIECEKCKAQSSLRVVLLKNQPSLVCTKLFTSSSTDRQGLCMQCFSPRNCEPCDDGVPWPHDNFHLVWNLQESHQMSLRRQSLFSYASNQVLDQRKKGIRTTAVISPHAMHQQCDNNRSLCVPCSALYSRMWSLTVQAYHSLMNPSH